MIKNPKDIAPVFQSLRIAVNDEMRSSIPTIYVGGDIVRGGATVILAMGDGRRAALNMDKQLSGK